MTSPLHRVRSTPFFALALFLLCVPPAGFAADVFKGREVYLSRCQSCHGAGGEGVMAGTPNFARGESLFQTDQELIDGIRRGKGMMPGFGGMLSDDDIANVVAYIRTFL